MPYESNEWSGYSIAAIILVIVAIIMIIVAIVWYEQEQSKPEGQRSYTGVTLLFAGGIIFFFIALFVGYSGRSKRSVTNEYSMQTTNVGHPGGYWPGPPSYSTSNYAAPGVWA